MAKDDIQWTTVNQESTEQESKIVFDAMGDSFTGEYLGMRDVDNENGDFKQARFRHEGELYFTNCGYSLKRGLHGVRSGSLVRITWVDEVDTGQESPMRVFQVEVGRASRTGVTNKVSANT